MGMNIQNCPKLFIDLIKLNLHFMFLMLNFCVYLDIIQGIMFRQDIVHHLTPVQSGQGTSNDHGNIIITGKDNLVSYNVIHS